MNIWYKGTVELRSEFCQLMDSYLDLGIVREATQKEMQSPDFWISPLNCLQTGENKFSILLHWIGNSCYAKPKMELTQVKDEGRLLLQYDSLRCEDLKSCYHQYRLRERQKIRIRDNRSY